MAVKHRIKITPSSGNVFRDLGFPAEEAEHLLIRADLLIQIQKVVTTRRLRQAQLAKLLLIRSNNGKIRKGAAHSAGQAVFRWREPRRRRFYFRSVRERTDIFDGPAGVGTWPLATSGRRLSHCRKRRPMIRDFLGTPVDPQLAYLLFFSAMALFGIIVVVLVRLQDRRERRAHGPRR